MMEATVLSLFNPNFYRLNRDGLFLCAIEYHSDLILRGDEAGLFSNDFQMDLLQ